MNLLPRSHDNWSKHNTQEMLCPQPPRLHNIKQPLCCRIWGTSHGRAEVLDRLQYLLTKLNLAHAFCHNKYCTQCLILPPQNARSSCMPWRAAYRLYLPWDTECCCTPCKTLVSWGRDTRAILLQETYSRLQHPDKLNAHAGSSYKKHFVGWCAWQFHAIMHSWWCLEERPKEQAPLLQRQYSFLCAFLMTQKLIIAIALCS